MDELMAWIVFFLLWENYGKHIFPNVYYFLIFWNIIAKIDSTHTSSLACFMTLITFCLPAFGFIGILRFITKGDTGKLVLNGILAFFALLLNLFTFVLAANNFIFNITLALIYLSFSIGLVIYLILDCKKINSVDIKNEKIKDYVTKEPIRTKEKVSRGQFSPITLLNEEKNLRIFEKVKLVNENEVSDKVTNLCPNCKTEISKDANYCVNCGIKIWRYYTETKKNEYQGI